MIENHEPFFPKKEAYYDSVDSENQNNLQVKNIFQAFTPSQWFRMKESDNDLLIRGKRDSLEIMAAIIVLTQKASTLTNIMYGINLSYHQTRKYLKLMGQKCLIRKITTGKRAKYEQTEKGHKLFSIYCEMLKILYGRDFLKNNNNLAVACLSYCQRPE